MNEKIKKEKSSFLIFSIFTNDLSFLLPPTSTTYKKIVALVESPRPFVHGWLKNLGSNTISYFDFSTRQTKMLVDIISSIVHRIEIVQL